MFSSGFSTSASTSASASASASSSVVELSDRSGVVASSGSPCWSTDILSKPLFESEADSLLDGTLLALRLKAFVRGIVWFDVP